MVQSVDLDTIQEGSLQIQGVSTSTIFWDDDQGPLVMVWDGMLPEEQERTRRVIVWEVKPPKGELGEQEGKDRSHPSVTAILEQFGTRLEGKDPTPESIESVWLTWNRDSPKDECKVQ